MGHSFKKSPYQYKMNSAKKTRTNIVFMVKLGWENGEVTDAF